MYKVLQWGDVKLILTASNAKINKKDRLTLDISDIKNGIQTYPVKFVTNKGSDTTITADVVMENRDADQTKIADTMLDINITLEERPSCHIEVEEETISEPISLGMHCDGENNMKTCMENAADYIKEVKNMTSSEVGGMYRYQGTDGVNNWICFGTSDKTTCTGDIDKYMYRIIGVTDDGQLALIKETGVKEGSTVDFYWNDKYRTSDCGPNGENCTWANSKIYNRLNGLCKTENSECNGTGSGSNGQTNIFIENSYYEYLQDKTWLDKISDHIWKYGDTNKNNGNYNGDTIYEIEDAFTNSIEAKIGLQYLHDYYYAYPNGNPGSDTKAADAWIHFSKDGNSEISYDWLISIYGVISPYVRAWGVHSHGYVGGSFLNGSSHGVRPVFYLKSDIKISNTAGSKDDPFMIEGIPEEKSTLTYLREKDTKKQLTDSLVGGMYRYQGTDGVNNWICFGTDDKTTCTGDIDKYMYRIIGVTDDGQLALIKETGIKEGSTVKFQWNSKYSTSTIECGTNGENCTWKNSRIYNRLNGLCKTGNADCDGTGSGYDGQTNIFINSTYYDYLNSGSTWESKISDHIWKYGDTTSDGSYDGDSAYAIENAFPNNVEAKIGLQYLHDYYYAYPDGKPGNYSRAKNAWIHLSKDGNSEISYEWLISERGIAYSSILAWYVNPKGIVSGNGPIFDYCGARPVFYLKSDIKISNTAGSKEDPFMIT